MANVAHSTLTGADLHEPKGVAAATAGKVYVSNGAGSGAWTALTTAIPGDSMIHVGVWREEQTSGTAGGTFTTGADQTRTINTEVYNNIAGSSLASNKITLPAGTYYIDASAPGFSCGSHKAQLENITSGTTTIHGTSEISSSAAQSRSIVRGVFTIAGTRDFEIRHHCQTTKTTNGFGAATSFGNPEVYTQVSIWRFES